MVYVALVSVEAKDEASLQEVLDSEALHAYILHSQTQEQELGCLSFEVVRTEDCLTACQPRFYIVGRYKDRDAATEHHKGQAYQRFVMDYIPSNIEALGLTADVSFLEEDSQSEKLKLRAIAHGVQPKDPHEVNVYSSILSIEAKDEARLQKIIAALSPSVMSALTKETGCYSYEILRSVDNPIESPQPQGAVGIKCLMRFANKEACHLLHFQSDTSLSFFDFIVNEEPLDVVADFDFFSEDPVSIDAKAIGLELLEPDVTESPTTGRGFLGLKAASPACAQEMGQSPIVYTVASPTAKVA